MMKRKRITGGKVEVSFKLWNNIYFYNKKNLESYIRQGLHGIGFKKRMGVKMKKVV
jgi:hypothetical protein